MKFIKSKKGFALLAAFAVAVVAAVGAYAYFTATGNGSSTAATGSGSAWTMTNLASGTLYSGESAAISGTVKNPGQGYQGLNSVTVSIDTAHIPAGCVAADFSLSVSGDWSSNSTTSATDTLAVVDDLAPNGTFSLPAGLSIAMADNGDQTNCQSASIPLTWSAN